MSSIILREYFDCLNMFVSKVEHINKSSSINLYQVNYLYVGEYIDGTRTMNDGAYVFSNMYITPKGAILLTEFSTLIRTASIYGKIMESLGRISWLIVGALLAIIIKT